MVWYSGWPLPSWRNTWLMKENENWDRFLWTVTMVQPRLAKRIPKVRENAKHPTFPELLFRFYISWYTLQFTLKARKAKSERWPGSGGNSGCHLLRWWEVWKCINQAACADSYATPRIYCKINKGDCNSRIYRYLFDKWRVEWSRCKHSWWNNVTGGLQAVFKHFAYFLIEFGNTFHEWYYNMWGDSTAEYHTSA